MVNKLNGVVGDFTGYPLIAVPSMADEVQARRHKKKRINKKWRKRYGMRQVPWKKFFFAGGKIYGHPAMIDLLIEEANLLQNAKDLLNKHFPNGDCK